MNGADRATISCEAYAMLAATYGASFFYVISSLTRWSFHRQSAIIARFSDRIRAACQRRDSAIRPAYLQVSRDEMTARRLFIVGAAAVVASEVREESL